MMYRNWAFVLLLVAVWSKIGPLAEYDAKVKIFNPFSNFMWRTVENISRDNHTSCSSWCSRLRYRNSNFTTVVSVQSFSQIMADDDYGGFLPP